jgi:hypothetical protein
MSNLSWICATVTKIMNGNWWRRNDRMTEGRNRVTLYAPPITRRGHKKLFMPCFSLYQPLSLASSTRIISLSKAGGDLFITLWTVRSNVDHASLWKTITTLVSGNTEIGGYFLFLHLKLDKTDFSMFSFQKLALHLVHCYRSV